VLRSSVELIGVRPILGLQPICYRDELVTCVWTRDRLQARDVFVANGSEIADKLTNER
jgi:hypothetical protein